MQAFVDMLSAMPEFSMLTEQIIKRATPVCVVGVTGSQKNHLFYAAAAATQKKCLVVASDEIEARRIRDDLQYFYAGNVELFPTKEYVFYDVDVSTHQGETARIGVLDRLSSSGAVVASVQALMQYTLPKPLFDELSFSLSVGGIFEPADLSEKLVQMGYKRVPSVEGVGQFAVRGAIVDIFSPTEKNPIRIEFFDDEVDSIRDFDPVTQVSIEKRESADICPVRELLYTPEQALEVAGLIQKQKNENLGADIEYLCQGAFFASQDKYMPFFYDRLPTLFDYLDDSWLIFIDEPHVSSEKAGAFLQEQNEIIATMLEKGLFPKCKGAYLSSYTELARMAANYSLVVTAALSYNCPDLAPKHLISLTAKTLQSYSGNLEFLFDDLAFWKRNGYRTAVLLGSEAKLENLVRELHNRSIEATIVLSLDKAPEPGQIVLSRGTLAKGFEYPTIKTVVVSDGELFRRPKKKRAAKKQAKNAIQSFDELQIGDYVVHRTHGIGQYVGIQQLVVDKVTKDYIKIKYKGSDMLYVPTSQLDLLHKYVGAEAKHVKVNSLGGTDWQKTTAKVKASVAELAEDLIKLYAARSQIQGHVYPPDTPWQKEFEETFPYEETKDQLQCIAEVKQDMEAGKSMDRLLCGDVGYGKTEVAMRAAFKCVMDSMQVAYLVPTTILAQQHYNNFCARMKDFPIKIEMLSRFRSKKEQAEIVKKLKSGEVDIVIGTHRLLQKDIKFKNLGLLIVDEEQRFGVGHKERIKEMKQDVDVLTLSATPIPRTLHMAMVGIRDLSVITEPPSDRYPVQTFVLEYNAAVVQNAMERELARGGQVYYLFNRVDGIERKAAQIKEMMPNANIAVAHGKMSETQLEEIMVDLLNGETDILVCTTIIETGLDIANVNTIVIENADWLGLSQLYQLRGRVGRSNRLAYAYLTYERSKVLDQVAQKRLLAIKEFTEFGSGFKIAMRDLEIRGAGNLLGKQQHGNMNLVGYDMYCMLLEQAVKESRGEAAPPVREISVELAVDAYIPKEYIEYEDQRVDMYKKIAAIGTEEDYYDVADELIDRYGDFLQSVRNLLDIALIKSMAQRVGITEIAQKDGLVIFTIEQEVSPQAIVELLDSYKRKIMFTSGDQSYLSYRYDEHILDNIKIILQNLANPSKG